MTTSQTEQIIIEVRKDSLTDFEDGYSHEDIVKAIELSRAEALKDVGDIIEEFNKPEVLKLSFSDLGVTCPICKKSRTIWSRISEQPRKEICIYCRINEFKQKLKPEKKK